MPSDSDEKFALACRASPDAMGITRLSDGRLIEVNPAFETMFGFPREAAIGQTTLSLGLWPDPDARTRFTELMASNRSVRGLDIQVRRRSGELFDALLSAEIIEVDGEEHILFIAHDITQRKQAEAARRASDERFALACRASPDTMGIARMSDGRLIELNPAFEKMFGFSRLAAIGQSTLDFWADPNARKEYIDLLVSARSVRNLEVQGRRHSGEVFDALLSAELIDMDGEEHVLFVLHDITERKQLEREVEQARDHLQERVDQRTKELSAAKEEAERANQAKSEFLSRMSHELRTPMNAILGFAQLMKTSTTEPLTAQQEKRTDQILSAGFHLLELINDVLDLSRVESGRMELNLQPVIVGEVFEEALRLVESQAEQLEVELVRQAQPQDAQAVLADHTRLKEVLLNLLSNGIKYNRRGGKVTLSCVPSGDDRVTISVTDTGSGIPIEKQARLFTPFDRLGAEAGGAQGTGIGLVISRHLVESMNGVLGFESTEGKGSRFYVEMPLAVGSLQSDQAAMTGGPSGPGTDHAGHCSLLYIEDELTNLELVREILSRRPHIEFHGETSGKKGIKIAREAPPDLILLDMNLHDIDGLEALKELKDDARTSHIPVWVVSADALEKQIKKAFDAGCDGYVTKPIRLGEFLGTIDAILAQDSD